MLLDDIHVVEKPRRHAPSSCSQNGTFESGATAWRLLGNHSHSEVIVDPDDPGNHVLRLVATGPTEHMHNHAETTLAGGRTIQRPRVRDHVPGEVGRGLAPVEHPAVLQPAGRDDAAGAAPTSGTPGTQNTAYAANVGPTYREFRHSPVVPAAGEAVSVSAIAEDPDGVSDVTLWYAVNGGTWTSLPMVAEAGGRFVATDSRPGGLERRAVLRRRRRRLGRAVDLPRRRPRLAGVVQGGGRPGGHQRAAQPPHHHDARRHRACCTRPRT